MRHIFFWCGLLVLFSCKPEKQYHDARTELEAATGKLKEIVRFQEEMNASFRNPESSPLPDRYRKNFTGLDFYAPDTSYQVLANFTRTPEAIPFLMPSTTDEKSREVVYGIASFELHGKPHQLEIYHSLDLMDDEGYEDYLFLPFTDETNGLDTYGGGRYIDLTIPDGATILIDFNKAYNPYCVYNKKYSCPLVPRQNNLRTKVEAGVKAFDP